MVSMLSRSWNSGLINIINIDDLSVAARSADDLQFLFGLRGVSSVLSFVDQSLDNKRDKEKGDDTSAESEGCDSLSKIQIVSFLLFFVVYLWLKS